MVRDVATYLWSDTPSFAWEYAVPDRTKQDFCAGQSRREAVSFMSHRPTKLEDGFRKRFGKNTAF